jgi:branched-chain amino acid transport system substrate-binding protein
MNKKAWIGVLVAASIIVVLAIVVFLARNAKTPSSITIGIMTPLTGEVASWGDMQRKSTEMVLAEIDANGGLHGQPVKVIYEDDQATPKVGVNAFKKLATINRVPIVVGSPASGVTLAVAPIANKEKVILLSSGSTATAVGSAGPFIFRIMPSDEVQAAIMAEWATDLGFRKIAVIYVQNAWGNGLSEAFQKEFTSRGGAIISSEGISPDATDFRGSLSKIAASKPDAIYAPLYTRAAGLMVRQAKELGTNKQILGADVYETPEFVEVGGKAADGVLFTRYGQYDGPEYQAFSKRYKELYGRNPEAYAAYCYDALKIALKAIAACPPDDISGPRIREELLKIRAYRGVTGLSTFDGHNSATGKTFDCMTVKDGKNIPWTER